MNTDFLKKYLRFNGAIINDKKFNANTKMKEPKLAHPTRQEVGVGEDIHPQFKPSWEEIKKEIVEPEQEELKGKDLLKRVYQGGSKVTAFQILDKLETHLEGHSTLKKWSKTGVRVSRNLKRGDDVKDELKEVDNLKGGVREITANKIPKTNEIWEWSNPKKAQQNATKFYKQDLYRSNRKDKKYMIKDPDGNLVHFGQMKYEDYTKHGDQSRRENYLKRMSAIKGNWKSNPFSPNALAMRILW